MESTTEKILYDIFVPKEWEEPVTIEVSCRLDVPRLLSTKACIMGMSDTPFLSFLNSLQGQLLIR